MTIISTPYASESQHWYTRDGTPAYEIIGANGKQRPTTLRDARKLNLVPSVTTILNEAAKPGLDVWKQKQVMLAAMTLPRIEGETSDAFCARVMEDSKAQGRAAAEEGTRIHTAVQRFYDGEVFDLGYKEHVEATANAIQLRYGKRGWSAERSFSNSLGFGGKTDLVDMGGEGHVVLDVKGKDFDEMPSSTNKIRLWWDENLVQLAAYRHGHGLHTATCGNVYVSRTTPGLVYIHEWEEQDLQRGWIMFCALLTYWQAKTGYVSRYAARNEQETS